MVSSGFAGSLPGGLCGDTLHQVEESDKRRTKSKGERGE